MNKKLLTIFIFLFALIWGANNLKKVSNRLQFEVFNRIVTVSVVELPICGASNIITVGYEGKKYNISINKNDCIQGRYIIGNKLEATYNSQLDEMNPNNFIGVYRLWIAYMVVVFLFFLFYIFFLARR